MGFPVLVPRGFRMKRLTTFLFWTLKWFLSNGIVCFLVHGSVSLELEAHSAMLTLVWSVRSWVMRFRMPFEVSECSTWLLTNWAVKWGKGARVSLQINAEGTEAFDGREAKCLVLRLFAMKLSMLDASFRIAERPQNVLGTVSRLK